MVFELSRGQFRTMILYDQKSDLNYRESHACLVVASENHAPSDRTVLNCFDGYGRGKFNVFDVHGSERSRTAVIEEMIDAVQLLLEDDPHLTYQQIE